MRTMYVRYLGTKACWTVMDGSSRFYIGDRDELTPDERAVCERGGDYMPLSQSIDIVARQ